MSYYIRTELPMKKIFMFCLIAAIPFSIFAQSIDEILQNHFRVINQNKLTSINSMQAKGILSQSGQKMPFKMTQRRPMNFRLDITFQGLTLIQAFDGIKGWSVNPFMGEDEAQEIPAEQSKNLKVQADMDGALFNWKDKGYTSELLPNEKVEGIDCFVIFLKDAENDEYKIFIDSETFLIIKQTYKIETPEGSITMEIYPSDYQYVEGIIIAFSIEAKADGQTIYTMNYDSVELNPKLDESYFKMPN